MTDFVHIQRKLINILLRTSAADTFGGRSRLLDGLRPVALNRSETNARDDFGGIIIGLHKLGRLSEHGGTRPLIIVVDNALEYVPPTSEIASTLQDVRQELERFYGGETQPAPTNVSTMLEALIFGQQRDTRLPFAFIENARRVARGIARLYVPRIFDGMKQGNGTFGTGWLIAPGMLITNHHVINARAPQEASAKVTDFHSQAEQIEAWFDYWTEGGEHLVCQGANLVASNQELDYALVQFNEIAKVADRQPLKIITNAPPLAYGVRLNIAQHSQGGPLRYAIRNNFYVQPGNPNSFIHYQTDTEPGASGSPVCDDNWHVLALHHASTGAPLQQVPQEVISGKPVTVNILNEAVTLHAILNHFPSAIRQSIIQAQLNV